MGEKLPALKNEIVLKSPGISQSDYARLTSSLPNLPESYLKCIQSVDVKGVSIGYFRLWPRAVKADNLVEGLVKMNAPEKNPLWHFLREKGFYEVAAWEAEPICVATKKSSQEEGSVLKISIAQPSLKENLLAPNFETFLLIAGNLDAIRGKHSKTGDRASASAEFEDCLVYFALPGEAVIAWKGISGVVFST
jgi:hypothetical protein